MYKLLTSIYKEFLLLIRDKAGIAILFMMPAILIIVVTLIQNSTYRAIGEAKLPIVIVDNDKEEIGNLVLNNLKDSKYFDIITKYNDILIDEKSAQYLVSKGKYQIAIIIPENLSKELNNRVQQNVEKILNQFSGEETEENISNISENLTSKEIKTEENIVKIFFDPASGQAFRNSVKNNIDKMVSRIETDKVYQIFKKELDINIDIDLSKNNIISFKEIIAQQGKDAIIPNAVQHNVPAWTLFAIFFIIVPLAVNIVKEKNSGTIIRLYTSPVSYITILGGKIFTFSVICVLQFILMLLIGKFIFPLIGLIEFDFGNKFLLMLLIAIFSGLAAIGLGILIGTIAKTQEQTAPFASILIIILAALGGVWVPTFIMPGFMQKISELTPINWGLSAFYDVILRNSSINSILLNLLYLFIFFLLTLVISVIYYKKKNDIY